MASGSRYVRVNAAVACRKSITTRGTKNGSKWGRHRGLVVGWGDAGEEESGYGLLKRRLYEQHVASQRGASSLLVCVSVRVCVWREGGIEY